MCIRTFFLFSLTCLSLSSTYGEPAEKSRPETIIYLAPDGDDAEMGSVDTPLATLERARQVVQELKKTTTGDITVQLRGGRYELSETVVFGLADGGSEACTITYEAYPGETPILSAGRPITNWAPLTEKKNILPVAAHGQVMVAEISHGVRTLFDAEGLLPRAKSAPFISGEGVKNKNQLQIPEAHWKPWSAPLEMEVAIRPHHAWIVNLLPIMTVMPKEQKIITAIDATYPMTPLHFLKKVPNCWIENALEDLDEPGEWVINKSEGKIYLWPRNDSPVYAPQLEELIRVEGQIHLNGPQDLPVRNLRFIGLTLMHGERYQISVDNKGLQHDWNFFDKGNALIRLRGTEHCVIQDCHFLHSGSGAIRVDLHAQQNKITGNHIEHLGGSGILLAGYGPGTKDVSKENLVFNNNIHNVGEIYWHSPGIMLWQTGSNRIANNLIHHTNYTGLIISGVVEKFFNRSGRELAGTIRWDEMGGRPKAGTMIEISAVRSYLHTRDNLIENNEIHNVMQKLGDGNAIYIRGSGPNNHIRRNYIHHLVTPMIMQCAIRTDGGQTDTLITENIIYKCTSQGMILKLNNRFENNIIADVIAPPRGYYLALREGPMTGASSLRNIFYSSGKNADEFVHTLHAKNDERTEDRRGRGVARITDMEMDYNIYYSADFPQSATKHLEAHQKLGSDQNSLTQDPLFTDPENGDFSLPANSPALKLGFIPIDQSKIGLVK